MRRYIVFIGVLLIATASFAVDSSRLALARSKCGKADKLLQKSDWTGAEKYFRGAIDDEPTYPDAYLGLATALCGQQRYSDAAPVLEKAKDAYIRWQQSASEVELQARQDAKSRAREFKDIQQQQKLRATGPDQTKSSAELMTASAATRVQTEDYLARKGMKMENFETIPAQVFYLSGLCALRTGHPDVAFDELSACVARQADHGPAHYNLAVMLFTRGDLDGAAAHLAAAKAAGFTPAPRFEADLAAARKAAGKE